LMTAATPNLFLASMSQDAVCFLLQQCVTYPICIAVHDD
jgi:hypothetical protein